MSFSTACGRLQGRDSQRELPIVIELHEIANEQTTLLFPGFSDQQRRVAQLQAKCPASSKVSRGLRGKRESGFP
jgi:hypothetical protein